jgi:hypothetical protein
MAAKISKDTPPAEPVGTDPAPRPATVEWIEPDPPEIRTWSPDELRRGALAEHPPLWGPGATGSAQGAPPGASGPGAVDSATESNGGAQDA